MALLGGRLFLLDPAAVDPVEDAVELDVVDDTTLRMVGGKGFGSYGEPVRYPFAADGTVQSVRASSAVTLTPLDGFRLGDRVGYVIPPA